MIADLYFKEDFLSPTDCRSIITYCEELEYERGKWQRKNFVPEINLQRRIALDSTINRNDEFMKPYIDKIDELVYSVNSELFDFDIFTEGEELRHNAISVSKMLGEEKAFVSNHQKVSWLSTRPHKKIYVNVLLSEPMEYEGGEMVLKDTVTTPPMPNDMRKQGRIVIIPAFKYSEVTTVLSGIKYTLNMVYAGPRWR